MKKIFFILLVLLGATSLHAQNYINGPVSVYGLQYNAATIIGSNGSIIVGNGGNWFFGGKVSNADKTTQGSATNISFMGTGTYSGAAQVNGYATSSGKTTAFVLPLSNGTSMFPITIPAGATVTAAYYDGTGSTKSATINGASTTIYSPYIDLPNGLTAGTYIISYPAGFKNTPTSSLLSGNSATNTPFTLIKNVSTFQSTGGTISVNLPNLGTTQIYFGTSTAVLPITIKSFTGAANGCSANLIWETSSENNSSYYSVEFSLDGTDFAQVGQIISKNNALGATYSFSYNNLSSNASYFRLKAVDIDGSFSYSQIVAVSGSGACSTGIVIKAYPNPTNDIVNLQGVLNGSHIMIMNMSGQKLKEIIAKSNSEPISLGDYPSGVYLFLIQNTDGSTTNLKIIKK